MVLTLAIVSTVAILLTALALAIVSGATGLTAAIAWRIFRQQAPIPQGHPPPAVAVPGHAETEVTPEVQEPPPLNPEGFFFAPEYLDFDALTALAAEVGVEVDPIKVESSVSQGRSAQVTASVQAALTIPGVADVRGAAGGAQVQVDLSEQAVAVTKRVGFTRVMAGVAEALARSGRLRIDLVNLPDSTRDLSVFATGLIKIYDSWGLRSLAPSPTGPEVTPTTEQVQRDAADLLWREATARIVEMKQAELQAVANEGGVNFALLQCQLRVAADADGSNLRLYNDALVKGVGADAYEWGLRTRAVVEVPLLPERLVDSGRQRLVVGASFNMYVFGRIGAYSTTEGTLTIHPIAVFSE